MAQDYQVEKPWKNLSRKLCQFSYALTIKLSPPFLFWHCRDCCLYGQTIYMWREAIAVWFDTFVMNHSDGKSVVFSAFYRLQYRKGARQTWAHYIPTWWITTQWKVESNNWALLFNAYSLCTTVKVCSLIDVKEHDYPLPDTVPYLPNTMSHFTALEMGTDVNKKKKKGVLSHVSCFNGVRHLEWR